MLSADYLPDEFHALGRPVRVGADAADDSLRALEARHIGKLMGELDGNKPDVARRLGIGLTTLYRKLEEYGLA